MKIAFIGQKGIPAQTGGVERYVEEVASRLGRRGHYIMVYNRKDYPHVSGYENVAVYKTPSIRTKHLEAITHTLSSIVDVIFRTNIDIIHINSVGPALLMPILKGVLRVKAMISDSRSKLVFTFHSADWEHGKWGRIARCMLKLGAFCGQKSADHVIYVSQNLKQTYGQALNSSHIPNGTDMKSVSDTDVLETYNLHPKKYIVYVGRLVSHKNVHVLIDAFQKADLSEDMKLVVVGDSSATDTYVKQLYTLGRMDERIVFTGNQQGASLAQLFSHAAMYVLPSASEGLSVSLLEAGSLGLPVIVSDLAPNREIAGEEGTYVSVGDVDQLRHAMETIYHSYETYQAQAKRLQTRIEKTYSWNAVVDRLERVYNQIVPGDYTHSVQTV